MTKQTKTPTPRPTPARKRKLTDQELRQQTELTQYLQQLRQQIQREQQQVQTWRTSKATPRVQRLLIKDGRLAAIALRALQKRGLRYVDLSPQDALLFLTNLQKAIQLATQQVVNQTPNTDPTDVNNLLLNPLNNWALQAQMNTQVASENEAENNQEQSIEHAEQLEQDNLFHPTPTFQPHELHTIEMAKGAALAAAPEAATAEKTLVAKGLEALQTGGNQGKELLVKTLSLVVTETKVIKGLAETAENAFKSALPECKPDGF